MYALSSGIVVFRKLLITESAALLLPLLDSQRVISFPLLSLKKQILLTFLFLLLASFLLFLFFLVRSLFSAFRSFRLRVCKRAMFVSFLFLVASWVIAIVC